MILTGINFPPAAYANKGVPIPIIEGISFVGPEMKFGMVLYTTTICNAFYYIPKSGLCVGEHKLQLQANFSI